MIKHFLQGDFWHAVVIIASALAILVVVEIVYRLSKSRFISERYALGKSMLTSFYLPTQIYVVLTAILFILRLKPISSMLPVKSIAFFDNSHNILFLFFLVWSVFRLIRTTESIAVQRHSGADAKSKSRLSTVRVLAQITKFTIGVIAGISALQLFGIPVSALLTFGGIGSVVIGFAAKDSLSNLLGGMMIFIDRPFMVGDWILSPDRNLEGTVENIGWRLTAIRTFDKRLLYVPNGTFSTISVENASRMSNRRIKTIIGVRYDDAPKIADILSAIKKMLQEHPEIDQNRTMLVNLVGFGDSALNVLIYTFTKTITWEPFQNIQQDVFLKILAIIAEHGAECAFPTRTLQFGSENLEKIKVN